MIKKLHSIAILSVISCFAFANDITYSPAKEEKPIVVVIPSYNNKQFYQKNLDSVFQQAYDNYSVIYINDASPDQTGRLVAEYIKEKGQEKKVTLINNKKNKGALHNLYNAIHSCDDNTIIVTLDGDDWFKDEQVLNIVNETYQKNDIWMTYGQYEELHFSKRHNKYITKPGHCKQIPPNIIRADAYREDTFVSSHLRTFYAGLFKKIKLEDFLHHSSFYDVTWDLAFMFPMLEMVKGKFKFIDKTLYVYNCITPINDFKIKLQKQLHFANVIKAKEKYQPQKSFTRDIDIDKKADIIILSEGNTTQLYAALESLYCYMSGIGQIHVLYSSGDDTQYKKIDQAFPDVTFLPCQKNNFKSRLEDTIQATDTTYIILSTDTTLVKDFVNIKKCIEIMDRTYAYGFYLDLGKNITEHIYMCRKQHHPPLVEIKHGLYAWQFQDGEQEWRTPHKLSMAIYRKTDIINVINQMQYDSINVLEKVWNNHLFDFEKVGLCFESSKTIQLEPTNKEGLVDICNKNIKINIAPLFLIKNSITTIKSNLIPKSIS